MKIFATSDTHNDFIILQKLKDFLSMNTFDFTIHCGDIGGYNNFGKNLIEFGKQQFEHLQYFREQFPKMLYILGNDDWYESKDKNYITSSLIDNVNSGIPKEFIGFEWVNITPFTTNREGNENKIAYELSKLGENFTERIIVAHDPPYACLDRISRGEEVGSKSIRKFIEIKKPKIWLCGHIHEAYGESNISTTKVFNCACRPDSHKLQGWVIDTETLEFEKIIK